MSIQSWKLGDRQRGQAVIIFVAAFSVLLGMMGVAIDFGFYYANRTQTQNAADAGALAGVQALGRHYLYLKQGGAGNTLGLSDYTDTQILQEITSAAAADIPTFTNLGSATATPTWPSGTGNSLTAYYLVPGVNGNPISGAQVGSGSTPTDAVGVRVEARLHPATLFAGVLGDWATHMNVYASARALLQSVGGPQNGPFVVCGGGGSEGAYRVKNANGTAPSSGTFDVLLTGTPPTVDYNTYAGNWYLVHSSQLASPAGGNNSASAACGSTNSSWKGSAATTLCQPTGATPLPCTQATENGDRSGPLANIITGLGGCDPGTLTNCVVFLGITNSCGSSSCTVVAYAPFYITAGLPINPRENVSGCNTSNCHTAQLLKSDTIMCSAGCGAPGGSFNPNNPAFFTYNLVPDS